MKVYILAIIMLLAGCSTSQRSSYLEYASPRYHPHYIHIAFTAPTGKLSFNIHALIHEPIRTFSLRLPESPPDPARYSYEQLQLIETSMIPGVSVMLNGGHVEFSENSGKLKIELQTAQGAFWANGEYPLRSLRSNKSFKADSVPLRP